MIVIFITRVSLDTSHEAEWAIQAKLSFAYLLKLRVDYCMLTVWLFPDVHHTWEEPEVAKISIWRKDVGTGEL